MGKKGGVGEEALEVKKGQQDSECYFNRQINKERYHLLPPLSPWKTDVSKSMPIPRCEYFVYHSCKRIRIFFLFLKTLQ